MRSERPEASGRGNAGALLPSTLEGRKAVWFAVLNPGTAVTLAVAQGERRLVYGQLGFMF
ncbi:MAG: hypothetical protein V3T08_06310 [Gemmatimonadota bacterium]